MRLAIVIVLLDACVFLSTCTVPPTLLDTIRERGTLRVVTRNSPTTYYLAAEGPAGPEYDLALAFADYLGVELDIYTPPTFDNVIPDLLLYQADLAAAGLTVTEARQRRLRFAEPYQHVTQRVVYRMGTRRPRTLEDLVGKRIAVVAGSSHAGILRDLKASLPNLSWVEVPAIDGDELMYWVAERRYDLTIVDSNEYEISRRYHPEIRSAMTIGGELPIAWALRSNPIDDSLWRVAQAFFDTGPGRELVAGLEEKYYADRPDLDYVGTRRFLRHIGTRFVPYQEIFEAAAAEQDLDWRLLAAVGYQESHWDPSAVSPTGVRGIMMLTQATARQLGIEDRVDVESSIFGGARYLRRMIGKIPARIPEPDRTYMALAAYNVGFGHLEDARILTQRHGKDADSWDDVREHLPLLAQRKYFSTVRYGYARGWEPVIYVDNIRSYRDLLEWYFSDRNRNNRMLLAEEEQSKPSG